MLAIVIVLTSGCKSLPVLEREKIRFIKINDNVEVINGQLYDESPFKSSLVGGGGAGNLGILAIVIFVNAIDALSQSDISLMDYLEQKSINIKRLTRNELIKQISAHPNIVLVEGNQRYDALISLEIKQYGIDRDNSFFGSKKYKPYIDLVLKIDTPCSKQAIWKNNAIVSADTVEIQGYDEDEYFSDKPHIQHSFKQAAGVAVKEVLKSLFHKN